MTNQFYLLKELIATGNDDHLRSIRDGFLAWLPIELIRSDDREIVDIINAYFEIKSKIYEAIEERAYGLEGTHTLDFEMDIFKISVLVKVKHYASNGDYYQPPFDEFETEIVNFKITLNYEN